LVSRACETADGGQVADYIVVVLRPATQTIDEGVAYARDLRTRAAAYGRSGDSIVILPGLTTIIGSTEAEAKRRQDELWELVPIEYSLQCADQRGVIGVKAAPGSRCKIIPSHVGRADVDAAIGDDILRVIDPRVAGIAAEAATSA